MRLNQRDIELAIELELESIDPSDYHRHSYAHDELVSSGRPIKRLKMRSEDDDNTVKHRTRK